MIIKAMKTSFIALMWLRSFPEKQAVFLMLLRVPNQCCPDNEHLMTSNRLITGRV